MPIVFEDFTFDTERRQLHRAGEPVRLEPKAYELLGLLLERRPKALSKAQIRDVIWPAAFVSETALTGLVTDLRTVLGDDVRQSRFIRTVHGFGYAFCGEAQETDGRGTATHPSRDELRESSPYPGLASFTEADGARFFGREAEVEALLERIRRQRLLAVIGPSGVGKTSFVRAGVVASRPAEWGALVMTPGGRPFAALAQGLSRELSADTEALAELIRAFTDQASDGEMLAPISRWRKKHAKALVVVDQFEEVFTQTPRDVQGRFARLLGAMAEDADVRIILTMRDDLLFRCSEHEALLPLFEGMVPLRPPTETSLLRAVREPASKEGYAFEDEGLAEEMVQAVVTERGALPLLAFAVSRLWEKRDRERKLLTREAYREIAGVEGALAQHAEATLEAAGPGQDGIVREIFRNLTTALGTRVSLDREELLSAFPDRHAAERVLRQLVNARLLTSYEAEESAGVAGRQRVEIVHESLLKAWPRLVRWRTQDADGAQLRDQLRQAAQLWQGSGQAEGLLWSGTAYRDFALWRERYPGGLSATEEAFAKAAARRAGRSRRRRRIAAAAVVGTLSLGLGVVSTLWSRAATSRQKAEDEARRAEASKLVTLAELRLREDPTEALAFTTASLEQADTAEARAFAMKALWEAPPAFDLPGGSRVPAFSPDGKWLAAAGHGTDALVWSEDGRSPLVLPGHEPSPRGPNLAQWASKDLLVTGSDEFLGSRAHVWSLPEGRRVRTIEFGRPSYWQVGEQLLLAETLERGSSENPEVGLLRSWALPDGEAVALGSVDWKSLGSRTTVFSPDGRIWLYAKDRALYSRPLPVGTGPDRLFARLGAEVVRIRPATDRLVVADKSGETQVWSFRREGPVREELIPKPDTAASAMLPDSSGRWMSGDPGEDKQVRLWDLGRWKAARPLSLRRSGSWDMADLSFHPRGEWVVASTARYTHMTFWPLSRNYPSVVDGYRFHQRPIAFSPDGKWLATARGWGDERQRLRLWPLPGSGGSEVRSLEIPVASTGARSLAFDPKNRYLFIVGSTGAWVVPLDGSAPRKLPGFSEDTILNAAGVSPSGRLVATGFTYGQGDKELRVWNLETGELRRFDLPEGQGSATGAGEGPTGYERGVSNMAFVGESTLYTVGDGGLRRWNLETGSHEMVAAAAPGYAMHGSFSVDPPAVLTTERRLGQMEDCPRGAFVRDLSAGASRPFAAFGECGAWRQKAGALDRSGAVAATGSRDGIVRVGRLSGGEPHVLLGHKGVVDQIAISPDLRWLASTGEDDTLRLWPMPDLSKQPLHTLPHDQLVAKLRSLTNLRVVRDPSSATGWKAEIGPFPGWKEAPEW